MQQEELRRLTNARYVRAVSVLGHAQPAALREAIAFAQKVERARKDAAVTATSVRELVVRCKAAGSFREAVVLVGKVFSDPHALASAFPLESVDALASAPEDEFDLGLFDEYGMEHAVDVLASEAPIANALEYASRSLVMALSTVPRPSLRALIIAFKLTAKDAKLQMSVVDALYKTSTRSEQAPVWESFVGARAREWIARLLAVLDAVVSRQSEQLGAEFAAVAPIVHLLDGIRAMHVAPDALFVSHAFRDMDELLLDADFVAHKRAPPGSKTSFCAHPWLMDAGAKYRVFLLESDLSQRLEFNRAILGDLVAGRQTSIPFAVLSVRRDNLVQDTLEQMSRLHDGDLRRPLKVQFIGEEGVDVGGVRKEYFLLMMKQLLDASFGMFVQSDESRALFFNPDSLENTFEFQLVGALVGLALYNQVILDVSLPRIVWKKLLDSNAPLELSDLADIDPTLMRGLEQLLKFDGDVEATFMRTFQASRVSWGHVIYVDLAPGGSVLAVTNANREAYVAAYLEYVLGASVDRQFRAFERGFKSVVNPRVLNELLVRPEELEVMAVGQQTYDFAALEASARYDDGYTKDSETVMHFWTVLHSLTVEQKKRFLRFVTGSDRVPIRGLAGIRLVISRAGVDSDRLPSAHTCFDHLLIPDYKDVDKLRSKLLLALDHAEGFGTQ